MNQQMQTPKGLTLAAFAAHKSLPEEFLRGIGVSENPNKGGEVLIRSSSPSNALAERHRNRTGLNVADGIKWTQPNGGLIVPYGLWRLRDAEKLGHLVLVNGESDCWTLWHHGIAALGIPGAQMTKTLEAEHLARAQKIYIIKEPDVAGNTFVHGVARKLQEIGWQGEAFIISMPDGIKDPNELHKLDSVAFPAKFQELIDGAAPLSLSEGDNPSRGSKKEKEDNRSPVQILIDIAVAKCRFFHTSQAEAFAAIAVDDHVETWPVLSSTFKLWLQREFYLDQEGKVPNQENLQAAINHLQGRANFDGPTEEVFTRVAEIGEVIYLDLCDKKWQAVEITAKGWRVINNAPVRFRRTKGMQPLPEPETGGSLETFRKLLQISDGDDWTLLLAWMVQALRPRGPYPILCFQGEQDTAKTTTGRFVRGLIDPSKPPDRALPRNEEDFIIAASNSWIPSFDNLSGLQPWHSDALCRLSTGGGFGTRSFYTNSEEVLFDATRPLILNGIDQIAEREDLLDRCLIIRLEPIEHSKKRTIEDLTEQFNRERPEILGALLDGVSAGSSDYKLVRLAEMPRMAYFAVWASAAESGPGTEPSSFERAYKSFRVGAVREALDADPVAVALEAFMEYRESWKGTATSLLGELEGLVDDKVTKGKSWPKAPNKLSDRLDRWEVLFERWASTSGREQKAIKVLG